MTGPSNPRRCLRCQTWHAPGRHGTVEVELLGGPADGQLFTVTDPPPLWLTVPIFRPIAGRAMWQPVGAGRALLEAEVDRTDYRRLELWNPRTRRRQYGLG